MAGCQRVATRGTRKCSSPSFRAEDDVLEGVAEALIEDRIDERIQRRVDTAKPMFSVTGSQSNSLSKPCCYGHQCWRYARRLGVIVLVLEQAQ